MAYFLNNKLEEKGWEKIEDNISLNKNIDEIISNIEKFRTNQQTKKKEIGFKLKKDDFLAVIENSANDNEISELKSVLKKYQNNIFDLKIEKIKFKRRIYDYENFTGLY